jgi:hypothetical protein
MYRPTVRYDDEFRTYVDSLFQSTSLDRNQIIRLALFLLGHTTEGKKVLELYSSSPLPSPSWTETAHGLWYGSDDFKTVDTLEGGTSGETDGGTSIDAERGTSGLAATQTDNEEDDVHVQENGLERFKRETPQRKGTVHKDSQDSQDSTIVTGTGITFKLGGTLLLPRG